MIKPSPMPTVRVMSRTDLSCAAKCAWQLLDYAATDGGVSPAAHVSVANALQLSLAQLGRLVRALEAAGLVGVTDQGDLVTVPQPRQKKGTSPATRVVVDDFGNAVDYDRRCRLCRRWLPIRSFYKRPGRVGPEGRLYECDFCRAACRVAESAETRRRRQRRWYAERSQDPAWLDVRCTKGRAASRRWYYRELEARAERETVATRGSVVA